VALLKTNFFGLASVKSELMRERDLEDLNVGNYFESGLHEVTAGAIIACLQEWDPESTTKAPIAI
jgi:hypothetical protein